ncbi:hypothetical protein PBY51_014916 [Eleginops maclovinus]|uniref:Uncharacterized protein n=1 Tax=Eleginops maclovinus TaxID=56733 RepID=A0AAN7X1M1_ELEMC|nr:hypothetical protein PBY51_014916 [Eleginops maclovinus]
MIQTPNSWSTSRETGGREGWLVVNNNFYPPPPPPLLPQQQGFNSPTASQSTRPHTRLQNTRDATRRADRQRHPRPRSLQNNTAPPQELQQDGTSGCQIIRRYAWQKGKGSREGESLGFKRIPVLILRALPNSGRLLETTSKR